MVRTLSSALALILSLGACAAAPHRSSAAMVADIAATLPAPKPLDHSLFVPRGGSGLSEEDLGRILDAPVEIKLPARVGVASIGMAFDPGAPTTLGSGMAVTRSLTESLEGSRLVTVASEMATEIPTGGGLEGLRELAARYRAPYLLLYSERFEDRTHPNGFAALWPTIVFGLLTPSQTLQGEGVLSVSLLDVRTGTILFTLHEVVAFEKMHLPVGAAGAFRDLQRKAADDAAKSLATRVLEKFQRVARAGQPPSPDAAAQEIDADPELRPLVVR